MYTCHSFFIHSSVDGHLGCFQVLVIVNSAAVNIGVHVFSPVLVSSEYVPSSGIAGSYGSFGKGNGNPLQYACLGNSIDRGAWRASVHGVANWSYLACMHGGFKGVSILSSIVAISIYIPANISRSFPFLNILSSIYCLWISWWWPFWPVWGDISLYFWFVLLQ